jgi:hypothetical protein
MSDDLDKKQPAGNSPKPPQRAERDVPLDTRMLSDAVIELNISRKNVGIYPPGHVQITKSIDRAFDMLLKLFALRAEMTLGVAKDTLFVGQDYLDQQNPVYRDFALSLYNQGIAAVTFIRGLDREQLVRFHRIITTKPEEISSMGGIAKVVENAGIPNIRVMAINYGSFHLTEEMEITHSHAKSKDETGPGLWGDFVSHLSAGTIAVPGQEEGISLKDAEQIDPTELARLLNDRKLDPSIALQSYDRVISSHVRVRAEQRQLTRDQSQTLRSLNSLLKDLHPDLRKQFLSVTFQKTADASPAVTEEIMGGLTDDMVIEMLQQANAEGREISPTLTGLLQKLASAGGPQAGMTVPTPSAGQAAAALTPDQFKALFNREKYENYISGEYDNVLKRLATRQTTAAPSSGTFPIDEYSASMTDEKLDYQIGRVLLGFIDEEIEDDDYGEFLKKVISNIPELLKTEQLSLLHDTFETLRLHSREKRSLTIKAMVDVALKSFRDPAFITSLAEAFDATKNKDHARAAGQFLLALGQDALPAVFELYGRDEAAGGKRAVFDLLCRFGNAAVQEAVKRLDEPRPAFVRNLVMLIRWGWDGSVAPSLRPLLKHSAPEVRMETLTALLRFHHTAATEALRSAIRSADPDESAHAVSLAGQFRVSSAVNDVLGRLKKMILFDSDYRDNEEIIIVLGEIGDPKAVPDLERIARGKWPLFPKSRARMKAVLFESLQRYPKKSIEGLISIGEQSDDPRVQRACRKLREGVRHV